MSSRVLPVLLGGLLAAASGLLLAAAPPAQAAVYQSKEAALKSAFPSADRVETRNLIPTPAEVLEIEREARSTLSERIVTAHVGIRDGEVLGYAFIDVHRVRTLPEALLVVLGPDGNVRSVRVLAFHEPTEYKPRDLWFRQFEGRTLDPELRLERGIHGVAGATLSSRAVTNSVRRALAIQRVLLNRP